MAVDIPRTLPEIIRRHVEAALADCHVAIPGKVVAYYPETNLADVDVQVQHSVWDDDNGRTYEDAGTLAGVPVAFPRAGGFIFTLPIQTGDTGLLVFNSDAIGEWRTSNQKSEPVDATRMNYGWPVFFPGLCADSNPPAAGDVTQRTGGLVLGVDGGAQQIQIPKAGTTIDIGKGATDFVALASLVKAIFDQLHTDLSAWTPVTGDGGAALKAKLTAGFLTLSTAVAATIARAK